MNIHFLFPAEDFVIFKIFGYSFSFMKLRQPQLLQSWRSIEQTMMFSTMKCSHIIKSELLTALFSNEWRRKISLGSSKRGTQGNFVQGERETKLWVPGVSTSTRGSPCFHQSPAASPILGHQENIILGPPVNS